MYMGLTVCEAPKSTKPFGTKARGPAVKTLTKSVMASSPGMDPSPSLLSLGTQPYSRGSVSVSLSLFTEVPRSLNVGKMLLSFFFFFPKEQSQYIWMDEFVRPFVCSLSTETMAFQNPCLMCAYPFWEYR